MPAITSRYSPTASSTTQRPTMAALKKTTAGPGLTWTTNTPVPTIGPRDVLIRVTHAGICGTDRHIYEWDAWSASRIPVGITTGHEFVGVVAAVGEGVLRTTVGQRVSAEGHIGCGVCHACRTGNTHICDDVQIIGIDRGGCFAEYVSVPEENVWPVHASIPDKIAAVMDPLGNAMHTVMAAGVSGKSVLITGTGIIGLMAVTIAKAAGAAKIIVTDIDDKRLAIAKRIGADLALRGDDKTWVDQARVLSGGPGPEVLLEMSGSAVALQQGLKAVRTGATVALLGIPSRPVEIDLAQDIIFKGLTVLGINGRRMFETWFQVEAFLLSGKAQLDEIVTHTLPFDQFERGFKLMQSGEGIKIVLEIGQ